MKSHGYSDARRQLLKLMALLSSGLGFGAQVASAQPGGNARPFAQGVASGSPTSDGFVLWTRLAQRAGDVAQAVDWEVVEDSDRLVRVASGQAAATADLNFAVHVEVQGLQPNRWYRYRFRAGTALSPWGRSRTLPAADDEQTPLRLAYASCQRWEDGHYAAYRHMLADAPDMVVFLGDYIYEYASRRAEVAVRTHTLKHARTLDDYRARYALYRSDPALQDMHAACPWLVTWDDHEVENNYTGSTSQSGTSDFLAQRVAAYQAFYEFMPIRRTALQGVVGLVQGQPLRVHQRVDFGRLASIHVLDNRQYRDNLLESPDSRSMLGQTQEAWLQQGLSEAAAKGQHWNLLAQQTRFAPSNYPQGAGGRGSTDTWDAFSSARQRLIDDLVNSQAHNPVFLGGDIHQNWVANVHRDPYKVASARVAAEFCGTSISSNGPVTDPQRIQKSNPHCVLSDSQFRGYGLVDVSRESLRVSLRVLDDARRSDASVSTLAQFSVKAGQPGLARG